MGSGFNPEYTGRDNVILNGLLLGLSRQEILSRFAEIEAFAEIGSAIDRQVKTYSSGMMMRLAFAVQVLCEPDILIIDEALSVGDVFFQQKCLGYIRGLCDKGTTLLFVSHDMGTVRDICKQGLFLKSGKKEFFGNKLEAIRRYVVHNAVAPTIPVPNSANQKKAIKSTFELVAPIWSCESSDKSKSAQVLGVNVLDNKGIPCSSVAIGAEVMVQVTFTTVFTTPVHVEVTFKNKYDQIVTSVGSYSLKTKMPALISGNDVLFQLRLNLAIEAGCYTFAVQLLQPIEGSDKPYVFLDETPWLGPFQVTWDYQTGIPPFHGLVGLPAKAQFVTEKTRHSCFMD